MVFCRKLSCKNLKYIGKHQNRGHTRAKRHVWFTVRVAYGTFARRHLSVYNDRKPLDNFKLPYIYEKEAGCYGTKTEPPCK